jgi:hypothetical protein
MFALAVCLMATVSSVAPTTAAAVPTAVYSTYDDAACELSELADSGECAPVELTLDFAIDIDLAPAVPNERELDCKGPRPEPAAGAFGTCDLPRPVSPRLLLAWLRSGGHRPHHTWSPASHSSSPAASPAPPDDSRTLLVSIPTALLIPSTFPLHLTLPAPIPSAPRHRLERPPRA